MPAAANISRLRAGDIGLMNGLLTMFGDAFDAFDTYCGRRPSRAYLERVLASDHFVALVATVGATVVGGLAAYELVKFEQERSEVYIYDLAVAAAHRRQGIATALIEQIKTIARARGAWVVFVQADYGDDAATKLYTKLGVRADVMHFDIAVQ